MSSCTEALSTHALALAQLKASRLSRAFDAFVSRHPASANTPREVLAGLGYSNTEIEQITAQRAPDDRNFYFHGNFDIVASAANQQRDFKQRF
jgi:hypothetical protein